ncbi:helix-turn-helix domain-containing protein, partial [Candidatus Poribacteria bacterium]|nr:helix-turn-helix domain-containing protein [Candidatus Poribacteria bacterium]
MNKELHTIIIDNATEEIIGRVVDFHIYGFSLIYQQQDETIRLLFYTLDDILDWSKENDMTIYYMIGGVRIPVNRTTYDKSQYLDRVGWNNLTPAEAIIIGVLVEEKHTHNGWVSTEQLQEVLTVFGFTPTSLRMLIVKIRQKLKSSDSDLRVKNRNRMGYQLIDAVTDPIHEFLTKESLAQTDLWILYNDNKLKHLVTKNIQEFIGGKHTTGPQILKGWQGLTSTEAEIFFELVKKRGEFVQYKFFLTLPWTTRYDNDKEVLEYSLRNFISKIRKKIVDTDQEIHTKPCFGFCLI